MSRKVLIIQTAFTGDVILATAVAEKIYASDSTVKIDVLVRKGNESLFNHHPFINEVLIWNKSSEKYRNLLKMTGIIRNKKYDAVINLQRFASTGFLTAFSKGKERIGFKKNPLSFLFTVKKKHEVKKGIHEIDRNQTLIDHIAPGAAARPRLYPDSADFMAVQQLKHKPYITIAPSSVWFTKTFPAYKWMEVINNYRDKNPTNLIYLLGSKNEHADSEYIRKISGDMNLMNLCGQLSLLESAALMKDAVMNYTNDSAPLHLAGAINAPVTAVYCSTVPDFGFGPLSDNSSIVETSLNLKCRPCGLHGYRDCPLIHFKCAHLINVNDFMR